MKKQVLFFLLMLMPLVVSAEKVQIDGIYYVLNQETQQAEVIRRSYTGNVVIPENVEHEGVLYPVTSIGDSAFYFCSRRLTSVTIPNSVTSIGEHAFRYCYGLTSITIGNSVTTIGSSAFYDCSSLTSVTIPNSVTSIGDSAFYGCSSLTSITIGNSVTTIGTDAFYDCSNLTSVNISDISAWCKTQFKSYYSNPFCYARHLYLDGEEVKDLIIPNSVTSIGSYAFYGCSSLTSVTIPSSVTSIGSYAFYGCSSLTSVTIPNSVTSIGMSAFAYCSDLTSVTIGNSVTSIGSSAFVYCTGLTSITIPSSVTIIGSSAFAYCSGLTSITIPSSVTSIERTAFAYCTGLTSVTIGNSVTSIGSSAFAYCSGLTSVTIGNSVTSIGSSAFRNCSSLTSVTIPTSVTSIGINAFSGCSSLPVLDNCRYADTYLVEVVDKTIATCAIKEGTRFIGESAFQGCSVLSSVNIGSGIKSIGSKAFANCTELKDMYCYTVNVPTLNSDTFQDTNYIKWGTLYVPEESVELYKKSTWSQYFGNIVGITVGNEGERCEKPVITLLANGKIKVESATEGATCVTNITASNAEPLTDGEISLSTPLTVYTVTAYATKEGYDDSEVATTTFRYEKAEGDINGDGNLNISDVVQLVNMILSK